MKMKVRMIPNMAEHPCHNVPGTMLSTLSSNLSISRKTFFYKESVSVSHKVCTSEGSIRGEEHYRIRNIYRNWALHNYERTHRRKDQERSGKIGLVNQR